jgi:hypothetical protein
MTQSPLCARFGLALACALGLVFAGCGGGGSTTTVVNKTVTVTQPTTNNATSTSAQTHTSTEEEPPSRTVHLSTFRSPTGTIGCVLLDGIARCDIAKRDWSPPPRPASCPNVVDFGQGLEVGHSGSGRFVCAGDTALDPTGTPLGYGTASQFGGFTCVSRSTGMTCTDPTTGHGFFISIQSYRAF